MSTKKSPEEYNHAAPTAQFQLTAEQREKFITSMKISYYRVFYKQGLITGEQLETLIAMQNTPKNKSAA